MLMKCAFVLMSVALAAFSADDENAKAIARLKASIEALKQPVVTVYKIVTREQFDDTDPALAKMKRIRNYPILDEKLLTPAEAADFFKALEDPKHHSNEGAECFDSGMAIQWKSGTGEVCVLSA